MGSPQCGLTTAAGGSPSSKSLSVNTMLTGMGDLSCGRYLSNGVQAAMVCDTGLPLKGFRALTAEVEQYCSLCR